MLQAIDTLIENFPELKSVYDADLEYYLNLPYVFYEEVFTKYIIKNINAGSKMELKKVFDFIEGILQE